ncbi:MAG TPA: CHAD domain-containing protein, partial [Longimicrobiales bacterium]
LHDFRVALRRLRSLLRGSGRFLRDRIPRRVRRRLRTLADASSARRDADVQRALIVRLAQGESEEAREWLLGLGAPPTKEDARLQRALERFPRLQARLRRRLGRLRLRPQMLRDGTVDAVLAPLARKLRLKLLDTLAQPAPLTGERLHAARITTKRLRYTLDVLVGRPGVRQAVRRLAALQDLLGSSRDLALLIASLEAVEPPAEHAHATAVVLDALRREHARVSSVLENDWLGDRVLQALEPVERALHDAD